jgi:microsomal dipeptidase-like Zn-dependent dipeptidase
MAEGRIWRRHSTVIAAPTSRGACPQFGIATGRHQLCHQLLGPDGARDADAPVELVVEHIEYMLEHVGEDGVGIGSDFDGARMPSGIASAAGLQNLVAAMRTRGFAERLIEKVCFRNWLRVLEQTWEKTD